MLGAGAGAVAGESTGVTGAGAGATAMSGDGAGCCDNDGTGATTGLELEGGCALGGCTGEIDWPAVGWAADTARRWWKWNALAAEYTAEVKTPAATGTNTQMQVFRSMMWNAVQ